MSGWRAPFVGLVALGLLGASGNGKSEQAHYEAAIPEAGEFGQLDIVYAGGLRLLPRASAETEAEDAAVVDMVLRWLRASRVSGISSDASTYEPRNASPIARFRAGTGTADALAIAPAYDCKTTTDGTEHCRMHPRHVVVRSGEDAWRVVAPELAEWLWTAP